MTEDSLKPQPKNIGYLALIEDPSGESFHEAIFIVDNRGYPLDYVYTDEIEVTPAQRIFYGKTLLHYIGVDICGSRLIEEIKQKPYLIIVNHKELLNLRKNIEIPVLYLEYSEKSDYRKTPEIMTHEEFQEDLLKTKRLIDDCAKNFNLMEPFERISKAIDEKI